jgi:hypothetical protein
VAGDQQQRVVGGRPEYEDEQDALTLPVEREHVVRGERMDDQCREDQREPGRHQHHDGQQRTAVDQDQDQRDDKRCDHQQPSVDPGEDLAEVRGVSGRTGDVRRQPGWEAFVDGSAHPLHRLPGLETVHTGHWHGDEYRFAVLGGYRRRRRAGQPGQPRNLGRALPHRGQVGLGQAGRPAEHHQRGLDLAARDFFLRSHDFRGLGVRGQERLAVVALHLAQRTRRPTADGTQDKPCDEHDGGKPPSAYAGLPGNRR